jgi:protocatechuate 3,4-dioxygenase alpha subunit
VLIEVWHADANGIHPHPEDPRHAAVAPDFRGWGRVISDFDTGLWSFDTIKPGVVMGRNGRPMAPHISLWIVARGINIGLNTRMYFDDEDNTADPVLNLIEHPQRRATLVADRSSPGAYRFDTRLQGDGETVFLDI